MKQSDTVYLLDASIYIFRAWFGYPDRFFDHKGNPVNAVYGYLRVLLENISTLKPRYMVAAFDESLFSGFRHQLYPDYKANRALPDPSLAHQLMLCRMFTEHLGIHCVADAIYEADDWIAWAAVQSRQFDLGCVVVTRDKDLAQIIRAGDLFWDWSTNDQKDAKALTDYWGVPPECIPDLLALMGDASDNIPGITGVGRKSAVALIQALGGLDTLYANIDQVSELPLRGAKRIQQQLEMQQNEAFLYRELTRLHLPPAKLSHEQLIVKPVNTAEIKQWACDYGLGDEFHRLLERYL